MTSIAQRIRAALQWIACGGLALNAAWWILWLLDRAASPRTFHPYQFRRTDPPDHWEAPLQYPLDEVLTWIAILVIEVWVMSRLILRAKRSPGSTCFLLAVICGVAMIPLFGLAIHGKATMVAHSAAIFLASLWLLALSIGFAILALTSRSPQVEPLEIEVPEARVLR